MQEFNIDKETNLSGVKDAAEEAGIIRSKTTISNWFSSGLLKGRKVANNTIIIEPQTVKVPKQGKPKK